MPKETKLFIAAAPVLDLSVFLEYLAREIAETGKAQSFDGKQNMYIQIKGCYAWVMSLEHYLELRNEQPAAMQEKSWPLPPQEATHILLGLTHIDETDDEVLQRSAQRTPAPETTWAGALF